MIRVLVWNEHTDDQKQGKIKEVYPKGMHQTVADFLNATGEITAKTAELSEPEHGLTQEALDNTDVLMWWGHCAHDKVDDAIAGRVVEAVQKGMSVIFMHSAHMAKPFRWLMGTPCTLKWREADEKARLCITAPHHPIVAGFKDYIDIPADEMYGECFAIPTPDEQIFITWFEGGDVFRGGCVWNRGFGRVFYFNPGHETYPIYHQKEVQQLLTNAVKWLKPVCRAEIECPNVPITIK